MAEADPLAAALEGIGERNERRITALAYTEATVATVAEGDVRLLLKAVAAVLELAGDWDAASRKVTGMLAEAGMPEAMEAAGTPAAGHPRAADLREAITRALTGEGGG